MAMSATRPSIQHQPEDTVRNLSGRSLQ